MGEKNLAAACAQMPGMSGGTLVTPGVAANDGSEGSRGPKGRRKPPRIAASMSFNADEIAMLEQLVRDVQGGKYPGYLVRTAQWARFAHKVAGMKARITQLKAERAR